MSSSQTRDHGGRLDLAMSQFGGTRSDWLDLSTGINPVPYPVDEIVNAAWQELPDQSASDALITAARTFWNVPEKAAILAAPGASSLIARIPHLSPPGHVSIQTPTYNEHDAAFRAAGWTVSSNPAKTRVVVHPNNPTGTFWFPADGHDLLVIDESFCDIAPDQSHIANAATPGTILLKSFGKFWGLAGLRLGFAIGDPKLIERLADMLGPWPVSGPALHIGTQALQDQTWAHRTRNSLRHSSTRLDDLATIAGANLIGGTTLFRLYDTPDAFVWQSHLAKHHIWSRIFPYSKTWLRLGLPHPDRWSQLETAFNGMAGGAMAKPSADQPAT